MATNLALDPNLVEEVKNAGKHRTKREAVTAAMQEYLQRRKQSEVIKLFGTIDYDADYDYKKSRGK